MSFRLFLFALVAATHLNFARASQCLRNPREIFVAGTNVIALTDDGIVSWGSGGHIPPKGHWKNPRSIQIDGWDTCAIVDQRLKCWTASGEWDAGIDNPESYATNGRSGRGMCIVKSGKVQCNTEFSQINAVPADISGVKQVAFYGTGGIMEATACVLLENRVRCWGTRPADVAIPGATSIAVGGDMSCATFADGYRCWGKWQNRLKQGLRHPRQIALGFYQSDSYGQFCVVTDDGLSCEPGIPQPPADLGVPTAISMRGTADTMCALGSGKVKCWGENDFGQTQVPSCD